MSRVGAEASSGNTRRAGRLARLVAGIALALCVACSESAPESGLAIEPPGPGAPNVLLITLDGLRRDHLSAFGYARKTSPNIDWLAERGLAFSEIVPSSCSTKISLTSLLTAQDAPRHGLSDHRDVLPDETVTLAEIFQSRGYETAAFVATAWIAKSLNYDQGFEVYQDFRDSEKRAIRADMITSEASRYLWERPDEPTRPFFMYLHIHEPHPPWWGGSPWLEGNDRESRFFGKWCGYVPTDAERDALPDQTQRNLVARYDGAIHFADAWIGALLASLRRLDLLRNTVVAISTDHGMGMLSHYSGGHGYTPFDEVTRGFLVLYDGRTQLDAGSSASIQGRIFDVGPTLLGLAGIETPADLDGVDLLRQPERLPEVAFSTCYSGEVARSREYKLIRFDRSLYDEQGAWPRGVTGEWMLFDLANDPQETRDVSAERPEVFARMREALLQRAPGVEPHQADPAILESLDPQNAERLRGLGYLE